MYNKEEEKSLRWLSTILDILRKECPWDSVQTTDSLRYLTIEEVYELSDAILAKQHDEVRKELGDIFMHLLFYSKLAEDDKLFTTCQVIDGICLKLISRHPHISLPNRDGVMQSCATAEQPQWEQVKMKEGRKSALEGVPKSLPPLVKAIRMQEKASGMGFDFPNQESAFAKVKEEYLELREALTEREKEPHSDLAQKHAEEEFGDLLFALIKWGRYIGLNPDDALDRANKKFQQRFSHIEEKAFCQNKKVSDLSLQEMVQYWKEAK